MISNVTNKGVLIDVHKPSFKILNEKVLDSLVQDCAHKALDALNRNNSVSCTTYDSSCPRDCYAADDL